MPDTRPRPSAKRRDRRRPVGAQGKPLSEYSGWDEAADEFRMDASLVEIEDYYRRIAEEDAAADTNASLREGPVKPKVPGEQATR